MTTEQEDLKALDAKIAELQAKRATILAEHRAAKLAEVKAAVQQFCLTAEELGLMAKGTRRKATGITAKTVLVPKYANPSDPTQTWHGGKGAKPKWVKAYEGAGGKLEDALIKK